MDRTDRCEAGCGRPARTLWAALTTDQDEREFLFCGVCSDAKAEALTRGGWVQVVDERESVTAVEARSPRQPA